MGKSVEEQFKEFVKPRFELLYDYMEEQVGSEDGDIDCKVLEEFLPKVCGNCKEFKQAPELMLKALKNMKLKNDGQVNKEEFLEMVLAGKKIESEDDIKLYQKELFFIQHQLNSLGKEDN